MLALRVRLRRGAATWGRGDMGAIEELARTRWLAQLRKYEGFTPAKVDELSGLPSGRWELLEGGLARARAHELDAVQRALFCYGGWYAKHGQVAAC